MKIDTNGIAKITFNKALGAISNLTLLSQYRALAFEVNPKSTGGKPYRLLDWYAVSMAGSTLSV